MISMSSTVGAVSVRHVEQEDRSNAQENDVNVNPHLSKILETLPNTEMSKLNNFSVISAF